jgi:hypothetical protein
MSTPFNLMQGRFIELMDAGLKNPEVATQTDKLAAATSALVTLILLSDAKLDQQQQIARTLRNLLRAFIPEARDPQFDAILNRNMLAFERDLEDLSTSIKGKG